MMDPTSMRAKHGFAGAGIPTASDSPGFSSKLMPFRITFLFGGGTGYSNGAAATAAFF
jgi:hypothetical protein